MLLNKTKSNSYLFPAPIPKQMSADLVPTLSSGPHNSPFLTTVTIFSTQSFVVMDALPCPLQLLFHCHVFLFLAVSPRCCPTSFTLPSAYSVLDLTITFMRNSFFLLFVMMPMTENTHMYDIMPWICPKFNEVPGNWLETKNNSCDGEFHVSIDWATVPRYFHQIFFWIFREGVFGWDLQLNW